MLKSVLAVVRSCVEGKLTFGTICNLIIDYLMAPGPVCLDSDMPSAGEKDWVCD